MARERGKTGKVEKTDAGNSSNQASAQKRGKTGVIGKQSGLEGSPAASGGSSNEALSAGASGDKSVGRTLARNYGVVAVIVGVMIALALLISQMTSKPVQPTQTAVAKPGLLDFSIKATPAEPYTPPLVKDLTLAEFVDRTSSARRVTPDQLARFPKLTNEEDVEAVVSVLADIHDDDTVRHEAAELLRRSGYTGMFADLMKILRNPHESARFRSWAIQHVYANYPAAKPDEQAAIKDALTLGLDDRDVEVQRESLLALVRLKDPAGLSAIPVWLEDPSRSNVQDLAVRCARSENMRESMGVIRTIASNGSWLAKRQALLTLAEWGDESSRSLMEAAANLSGNTIEEKRLRSTGTKALQILDKALATQQSTADTKSESGS